MLENICSNREHLFIVGSSRSGTSLLHSILQQLPMYALYSAEPKILYECRIKYGNLNNIKARKKFLNDWFRSRQHARSGLSKDVFQKIVVDAKGSYAKVLCDFMDRIAEKKGCNLWIDDTPSNVFCLDAIAGSFPNARVLHIIRDGRAVALSLAKLGWAGIETNNFNKKLYYSALKWEESIQSAKNADKLLPGRYLEIRYEDLVGKTKDCLEEVLKFINVSVSEKDLLDKFSSAPDKISKSSLNIPNSAFGDVAAGISTNAAYRWKKTLIKEQIILIENHIRPTLKKLNYPLIGPSKDNFPYLIVPKFRRFLTRIKRMMKHKTSIGKLLSSPLEIGFD